MARPCLLRLWMIPNSLATSSRLSALALGWPDDRRLIVRSLATPAGKVAKVSLLGCQDPLSWEQTDDGLVVTMPEKKPCEHVFALKIDGNDLKPAPVKMPAAAAIVPDAAGRIVLRAAAKTRSAIGAMRRTLSRGTSRSRSPASTRYR